MEREKPRSRKKKTLGVKPFIMAGGAIAAAAALIAGIGYYQTGKRYEQVFFPNTVINGIDASKKGVKEVEELISSGISHYTLSVLERDGKKEEIKGTDIGLEAVFDGSLEALLQNQEAFWWPKAVGKPKSYEIDTMIQYDQNRFEKVLSDLSCFNEELMAEPENAYISDYTPGQGYRVIAPKPGNKLEAERAKEGILEAAVNLKQEISLEELNAYASPKILQDDPALMKQVQTLNQYAGAVVTHTFGEEKQVLSGETISQWIGVGEDGEAYLDSQKVKDYVKELASQYDTYNRAKSLETSYGQVVKIKGGVYGWRIDQNEEADELAELIRSGLSQTREPVYRQEAASRTGADYGTTYVEINLTAQHLYFYKDGKLVVESDFVSGNEAKGWSTPAGVYPLTYKQRNAVLKGETYRTPVDYWMPFNGGIGLHDATWRNTFGGTIYKNGGSHGCVNLPHSAAKAIYENITAGIPVLCYHLEGTQSKKAPANPGQGEKKTSTGQPSKQAPQQSVQQMPPEQAPTGQMSQQPSQQPQPSTPQPEPLRPEETLPSAPENEKNPGGESRPSGQTAGPNEDPPVKSTEIGPGVSNPEAKTEGAGPGVNR